MKRPYFNEEVRWSIIHNTMFGAFKALELDLLKVGREIEANKRYFMTYYAVLAVVVILISLML